MNKRPQKETQPKNEEILGRNLVNKLKCAHWLGITNQKLNK